MLLGLTKIQIFLKAAASKRWRPPAPARRELIHRKSNFPISQEQLTRKTYFFTCLVWSVRVRGLEGMGEGRKVKVCVTRCGQKRPGKHPTTFHDLPNFIIMYGYKSKGRRKAAGSMQPKETSRYIGLVSRPPSLPRALLSSAFTERPAAGPTACQPATQPARTLTWIAGSQIPNQESQSRSGRRDRRSRSSEAEKRGEEGEKQEGRREGEKTTYSHAVESEGGRGLTLTHSTMPPLTWS